MGMIDLPMEQRQEPWLLDMPRNGGHVLIGGASGSGKSVFLRTLITSLALTHSPVQLHFYLIDFGGQALRVFEKLPHVGGVFGEADTEYISRLLRKLEGIIEERRNYCATHSLDDFLAYQRRRAEKSDLPEMPAVVLVIDKFVDFKQANDKEMDRLLMIARQGRTYGVYLVLSVDRPISVPMQLMSLIELRIALRLIEYTDSLTLIGKNDAASLDPAIPGRGYKRGKTLEEVHIALPVPGDDDDEQTSQLDELVASFTQDGKVAKAVQAPPIRLLPEYVRADYFLMDAVSGLGAKGKVVDSIPPSHALSLRVGLEDFTLRPIALDLNSDTPHVLVAGGPGSGRTSVLQTCLLMLATPINRRSQVILVDFRRGSRLMRRLPNVHMYADTEERLGKAMEKLKEELRQRTVQLHEELEKTQDDMNAVIGASMSPLVLVIDDYDQLSVLSRNPLSDLKEFMPQARDLHFHVIVAGPPSDLMRSDPLLNAIRASRLGIVLGGDPNEPQVLGVRLSDMAPGRGYLVRRNQKHLVQLAHLTPSEMVPWVYRLAQFTPIKGPTEQESTLSIA
jgi:S-DNA-T family DNA segregation ATPase FtsK/SpoIIIE